MNNTTNTTDGTPKQQTIDEAEKMFKIVFYVGLFIVGTIGNLLVVIVIKGKRQRTVNDYFILNLAISDLTFLCFSLPFYYYELFEKFIKFQFYCKFVWPMMSVSLFVGIFTLTFMSVERCRAILFPFRPRITKATLFLGMIMVWASAILCIVPLMVVASAEGIMCLEHWPSEAHRKAYTAALFILQFVVPITVIAVAYITIIVKLIKTKVPNRTSVNHRGQLVKQKTRTEHIHIIRTVAIIVILFVVCMLPNQIAWILMDFGGEQYMHLSEKFWLLAEALMFLHSCVNPIIYGSITRQFREGYIKYVNFICCCGRSAQKAVDLSEHRHYIERPSQCPRQGTLTYRGSLKSPSVIKRLGTGSTQAATVISSLTYRTSSHNRTSPSTPAQLSPLQLSPVLLNNKLTSFEADSVLKNDVCSGAVEVHGNSVFSFIPSEFQKTDQQVPYKDDTAIINQGVILLPENMIYVTDIKEPFAAIAFDETRVKPFETRTGFNLNSKHNKSVESIVFENQMDHDFEPVNEDMENIVECTRNKGTKKLISRRTTLPNVLQRNNGKISQSQDESIEYDNDETTNTDRRCSGPSVNYGIVDDEEHSLQDTHL